MLPPSKDTAEAIDRLTNAILILAVAATRAGGWGIPDEIRETAEKNSIISS